MSKSEYVVVIIVALGFARLRRSDSEWFPSVAYGLADVWLIQDTTGLCEHLVVLVLQSIELKGDVSMRERFMDPEISSQYAPDTWVGLGGITDEKPAFDVILAEVLEPGLNRPPKSD